MRLYFFNHLSHSKPTSPNEPDEPLLPGVKATRFLRPLGGTSGPLQSTWKHLGALCHAYLGSS